VAHGRLDSASGKIHPRQLSCGATGLFRGSAVITRSTTSRRILPPLVVQLSGGRSAAAIAALIVGAMLSRIIEPGVRVEQAVLTGNTPSLRLSPATPGPHPIALLAHGATGSKENLFRFGEALAAAGFDCYSVDQAGHGESRQPCAFWHVDGKWGWATNILPNPREVERGLGSVGVFLGHSVGGGPREWS